MLYQMIQTRAIYRLEVVCISCLRRENFNSTVVFQEIIKKERLRKTRNMLMRLILHCMWIQDLACYMALAN